MKAGLGVVLMLAACQPADSSLGVLGDTGAIGSAGPGGVDATTLGDDTFDSATQSGTDEDDADDGIMLDVGAPALDFGGGCPDGGCKCGAVDLLFVVDNSEAMAPVQQSLAEAFPELVTSLTEQLPAATSLHVGVTSTTMGLSNMKMGMERAVCGVV